MVEKSSSRQHQILERLLENKNGLSIDDMAKYLDISRTAVQQHFVILIKDGFIRKKQMNKTGGRPVSLYELTDDGINYFPKQYAWLTGLIVSNLTDEIGPERMQRYMQKLGASVAEQMQGQLSGKNLDGRIEVLAEQMNEMGFQVNSIQDAATGKRALQAFNCVYHDLAQKNQVVCAFDSSLISVSLGKAVVHSKCMAKGDCSCRFIVEE